MWKHSRVCPFDLFYGQKDVVIFGIITTFGRIYTHEVIFYVFPKVNAGISVDNSLWDNVRRSVASMVCTAVETSYSKLIWNHPWGRGRVQLRQRVHVVYPFRYFAFLHNIRKPLLIRSGFNLTYYWLAMSSNNDRYLLIKPLCKKKHTH